MNIDWSSLGFHYTETDYIVRSTFHGYRDEKGQLIGQWSEPEATRDKYLHLHVSATALQYGQEAFEGLKAFRGVDGQARIFRMEANAERMQRSAEGLYMAPVPTDLFCKAIRLALVKNIDYLPPYETGATLYFRPLLIGSTPRLGVGPGVDFEFIVIPSPVGPYYPGKFRCTTFIINNHIDRAAPLGTGQLKVGGNYASSFRATEAAHLQGYDCMFTDAKTHSLIDECSASNFIGIRGNQYITPRSSSILPSITNDSLMTIAREMGYEVIRREIPVSELSEFEEAGCCGTACVISPIGKVIDPDNSKIYTFGNGEPGPKLTALYQALQDIQYGRTEDVHRWCTLVESVKCKEDSKKRPAGYSGKLRATRYSW